MYIIVVLDVGFKQDQSPERGSSTHWQNSGQ